MSQRTEANERTVVFGHLEEGRAAQALAQNSDSLSIGAGGIPQFKKVEEYTTFSAEWVLQDGNIVIHFFLPTDFKKTGHAQSIYWTMHFPIALDQVAQSVFQATAPRLQAKYTEELNSWWFRACKYDHIIDLVGFLRSFFDALDQALEQPVSG